MAATKIKEITEMTKAELIELAKEVGLDLDPTALKADLLVAIQAAAPLDSIDTPKAKSRREIPGESFTPPEASDDKPKIVPTKHDAMCGIGTIENHETRIHRLEEAVAYLLAQ